MRLAYKKFHRGDVPSFLVDLVDILGTSLMSLMSFFIG